MDSNDDGGPISEMNQGGSTIQPMESLSFHPGKNRRFPRKTNECLELQTTSFSWLFQLDDSKNLYMGNGCLTKHPLKTGCLEFQVTMEKTQSE